MTIFFIQFNNSLNFSIFSDLKKESTVKDKTIEALKKELEEVKKKK